MDNSIGNQWTKRGAEDRSLGGHDTLKPAGAPIGRIDQFELMRELGGGGFGVVYLARDTVAGVDVAVKGLPPLVKNNADELERIRENFALVSKLHHPHIAAALHLHPAREVSYADEKVRQALRVLPGDTLMVMAYAPGVTLNRWRKQFSEGKVPVVQTLEVCRQIAAALDYAHGEKVVHRDVKPSNVMVETRVEGRGHKVGETTSAEVAVRVLDFGLAAEIRSSMSRVSQERGDTSGTRPYMAPEQWAGRRQDGRTDQYALAVLFYELVSGAVPFASAFDTGDPAVMANAAKMENPESLAELTKAQSAALLRGLAKEPAERFATCGDLVVALGGRASPRAAGAEDQRYESGGRKAALALTVAAVLGFGSYGAYTAYRSHAARLAGERVAAERAATLDAAQRAKAAELKAAAEAALASGDLEAAGARIAELKGAGGAVDDLQKKYESKAGEREANKRYAAASVAREKVQKLERGQGLGAKLDALEVTWREAEAARQSQGWGQALSGYDAALAACKALEGNEVSRQDAKTRRGEAEKAIVDADQSGSASDANDLYAAGGRAFSRAAELFEKGSFVEASKAWQESAVSYASAKALALSVQACANAKSAFETELGGPASSRAALLDAHGGAKWAEVKRLQKLGEASANDPAAGAKAYRDALAGLLGAADEAQAAEKAEAERLAAEKKAREELQARERAENDYAVWKSDAVKIEEQLSKGEKVSPTNRRRKQEAKDVLQAASEVNFNYLSENDKIAFQTLKTEIIKLSDNLIIEPSAGELQSIDLGNGAKFELVWCPSGSFMMGTPYNEDTGIRSEEEDKKKIQHRVILTKGFWLGKTEVTQKVWENIMGSNPSFFKNSGPNAPVEQISWFDCQEFIRKLNARVSGGGFRLPTEAEWEYACRAGTTTAFHFGNELHAKYVNLNADGYHDKSFIRRKTLPVGSFVPNAWGLYDMHGNVWEWCQDWLGDYPLETVTDPKGPDFGSRRIQRGGGWDTLECYMRSASRGAGKPEESVSPPMLWIGGKPAGDSKSDIGLRLARDLLTSLGMGF